jgi:outer membrane protein OmpA-like peptidoglycan-associated protein
MKRFMFALFLTALMAEASLAQFVPKESPGWFNRNGRWSVSLQGGGNIWINDFDTRNITSGGDLAVRYSLSRAFTLGVMGGFDVIESKNNNIIATNPAMKHSFIQDHGYSADVVAWFHTTAGKTVSPYFYLGVGGFMYKRIVENDAPWTEDKSYTSIHVPIGVGLDIAVSKHLAISAELGARVLDNHSDNYLTGAENFMGTDWYATGRLGLNFYLGESDDDDTDGDGLTNGDEKILGTDLNKADTDGDGLSDYEEVVKQQTDPKKADTDGDGLNDGDEVIKYHTSPLKTDSDGDGLSDGEEVAKYHTDPLKVDTDGDGLKDGEEVNQYHTDPLKVDTDGDGLKDGEEVTKYHTDPLKVDTDGGTVNDGTEVGRGSNPLDASDDVPKPKVQTIEVGKAIVLEGIVFASNKSTIQPESETTLEEAFNTMKENSEIAIEIRGYTDNVGKVASNKKLSLARAEAVRSWLVKHGIDSTRIGVKGYGPENPISDNSTPEGRQKNRRIEFFRTK